jgi:TfoX/Sxy family transcriptional regulator of competence genes
MAFNTELADRLRITMASLGIVNEKRMFGGVAFFNQGNMATGVHEDSMIVRVGSDAYEAYLSMPHVRVFDMTGRPMKGWVQVARKGLETDADLLHWAEIGYAFAGSLPPKE